MIADEAKEVCRDLGAPFSLTFPLGIKYEAKLRLFNDFVVRAGEATSGSLF